MPISNVTDNSTFLEWKDITNIIIDAIGDLDTLTTSQKTVLVAAINELDGEIGDLAGLTTTAKDLLVNAINELDSEIGDLSILTTTITNNLVNAINELNGEIGNLTLLQTLTKDSIVNAINELNGEIGNLTQLQTTAKDSLVNAINEIDAAQNGLGDLTTLTTTDKSTAVAAINELNANKIENENDYIENMFLNNGRFMLETDLSPASPTFNSGNLQSYNSSTLGAGEKFSDNNGGTLPTNVSALMTELTNSGRTQTEYGYDFYLLSVTSDGISTNDPITINGSPYYPQLSNNNMFLGRIGETITWQCWVYNTDALNSVAIGHDTDTTALYINGNLQTPPFEIISTDGWVHVREQITLTKEYDNLFPHFYVSLNVVQFFIALPALFRANTNITHLGLL